MYPKGDEENSIIVRHPAARRYDNIGRRRDGFVKRIPHDRSAAGFFADNSFARFLFSFSLFFFPPPPLRAESAKGKKSRPETTGSLCRASHPRYSKNTTARTRVVQSSRGVEGALTSGRPGGDRPVVGRERAATGPAGASMQSSRGAQ